MTQNREPEYVVDANRNLVELHPERDCGCYQFQSGAFHPEPAPAHTWPGMHNEVWDGDVDTYVAAPGLPYVPVIHNTRPSVAGDQPWRFVLSVVHWAHAPWAGRPVLRGADRSVTEGNRYRMKMRPPPLHPGKTTRWPRSIPQRMWRPFGR